MESASQESNASEEQRCKDLIGELPADYLKAAGAAMRMRHTFHRQLSAEIESRLNRYLKSQPQESLEEKRELASWVNAQLRHLGLTIRCPKTGNPATLIADFKNSQESHISRFRIQGKDEYGKRVRSSLSDNVPDLELMEDIPRRESLARGYQPRKPSGRSR